MSNSVDKNNPEIMLSICVVSYNHEAYIKECMDHIFEQKMNFSYEVLVGNDCSTDATAQILEQYKDKAEIINRTENYGLCANLYDLFLRARGKYVFNFSGDDYLYDPSALQKQVDFLESHPEYYAVSAWNYTYRESDGKMYGKYPADFPREFTLEDFLREGNIPTTHGMMRNTFAEDKEKNHYLIQGARNNEEMKMWFYTLSKGKRYIFHEFFHVYRSVENEGMSNYNSTHTILDMFKDNYGDLCILRELFHEQYNFTPMILKRSNTYCIKLSDNRESLKAFFKELSFKDAIMLIWYKLYLKTHKYHDPEKWSKKEYLILK
ncbi:MAG: glycosyltransferase family 2 protein [Lachnospiraceae bacterium]